MATYWQIIAVLVALSVLYVTEARRTHHHRDKYPNDDPRNPHREHRYTCRRLFHGCTVQENRCWCSHVRGCKSPWPYSSEEECKQDQKGSLDICKLHHPCGRGFCLQVKREDERMARCECAGSGYYGYACQYACPPLTQYVDSSYPTACLLP